MPTPDALWIYFATIGIYLAVLTIPGVLIGIASGLRGWALAGLTPLLTYAGFGLAGPWLAAVGLPYNIGTAGACVLLLAGLAYGLSWLVRSRGWGRKQPQEAAQSTSRETPLSFTPRLWTRRAHLAVAGCVALVAVLSVILLLTTPGGPSTLFRSWDPVYHANGIRYIAESGDGSLFGMSTMNWYPNGSYYPNAYHLLSSLVYAISPASVSTVLNVALMLNEAILALSLVALVRQFGGRATLAGCTALVAGAATTGAYQWLSSELLPYSVAIALTPIAVVALIRYLEQPSLPSGLVLALSMVGLFTVHSSALFGAILLAVPLFAVRWWSKNRRKGTAFKDLLVLLPVGVGSILLITPHLLGAIGFSTGNYPYQPWASDVSWFQTLGRLATFRFEDDAPQIWFAIIVVLGILTIRRLGNLRWIGLSALFLAIIFWLVSSHGANQWVILLSRPWWNDYYRLASLAAIPLILLGGHGLAQIQHWLATKAHQFQWVQARPRLTSTLGVVTAFVVILTFAGVTKGLSSTASATPHYRATEEKQEEFPLTAHEVDAMMELKKLVAPGEKVLNDRTDGSPWMYPISGVHPVAAHYDAGIPPADAGYLAAHFREYDTNPEVRAAVQRLNVRHVMIGQGRFKPFIKRAPGLDNLEGLGFLRTVYANPDATIYAIVR